MATFSYSYRQAEMLYPKNVRALCFADNALYTVQLGIYLVNLSNDSSHSMLMLKELCSPAPLAVDFP